MLIITLFIKIALSIFKFGEVKLWKLFTLVLIAEFIFLIPDLLEVIWFLFLNTDYSMEEVKFFMPLNLYSFIHNYDMSEAYDYPVRLINPFEIAYWLLLIIGIKELTGKSAKQSFKVIASSYGVILLIVIVFRFIIYSTILHA